MCDFPRSHNKKHKKETLINFVYQKSLKLREPFLKAKFNVQNGKKKTTIKVFVRLKIKF